MLMLYYYMYSYVCASKIYKRVYRYDENFYSTARIYRIKKYFVVLWRSRSFQICVPKCKEESLFSPRYVAHSQLFTTPFRICNQTVFVEKQVEQRYRKSLLLKLK